MKKNKIIIIIPYKESLNLKKAGAVSIYVADTTKYSKFNKNIKIHSSDEEGNIFKNKNYILDFCKKNKNKKIDIIEIHNRPEYVKYIKKYFPKTKIILIYHNDPVMLRGSEKLIERENLLNICSKILFVSKWIQNRFFYQFINSNYLDTEVVNPGIKIPKNTKFKKNKNILFVGKLNEAKGYHIFVEAAKKFKKHDKSWNFIAIGDEPRKKIFPDKNIINEIGYKSNKEVLDYYSKSEISVGNSVWNEPFGRLPIESSSRYCLPIITDRGGLNESKDIGYVLKKNSSDNLFKILKKLTQNKILRKKLQIRYYSNNKFDIKKKSLQLDLIRTNLINNKNKICSNKKIKILHIANFNELSDGRLFYSFSNKLNNGFIKEGHIVQTISDRSFLKYNKSILKPFGDTKRFNIKILNTIKNFAPDLIIFGHVFNIENNIFDYCNLRNIKTASWFIDSVSNEFLNGNKKIQFLNLIKNVDRCFITSSPEIFNNKKFFNKLKFIPNPIDNSIDHLRNYKALNLEYDVFLAVSHGQNRAILKKNKKDDREDFLNKIINGLNKYKFTTFGFNNTEPVWGSNYFYHLSKSKIALNISRGKYQKLYSSDRISSLMGNGLLVFLDKKTGLQKIFKDKKEAIFFKNKKDLIHKLNYYLQNDQERINVARRGCFKYHKKFSNTNVVKFILSELKLTNDKINWFK